MIDRFTWCACCILVLIAQFILSPIAAQAAAPTQTVNSSPAGYPASTLLRVAKSAGPEIAAPGEVVSYDLTVANITTRVPAPGVRLMYVLPAGFRLKKESVRINGTNTPEPATSADGKILTFSVGDLPPATSSTISCMIEIPTGLASGKVVIAALATSSDGSKSNIAKAIVTIIPQPQTVKAAETPASPPQEALQPLTAKAPAPLPASSTVTNDIPPPPPSPQAAVPTSLPEPAIAAKTEKPQTEVRAASSFTVPEIQSLAQLIGMSEISVLTDVDGQFVKNMAEHQVLEKESAELVTETSLWDSIRTGRNFNRESRAALARTDQAKAQTGQAFALLLPTVSVHANYGLEVSNPSVDTTQTGDDAHSRTDASFSARQPLFDLPSFKDWQRRKVIEQARGESYRVSDGDAYISTANAYLSLVSSRLQTDMTREFETQLTDLYTYIEKRASAGAASVSDMARVRARKQATQSSRLEQESAHAAAGVEFVRLTNLVPKKVRLPELEALGASLLPKSLDMAVSTAMKSNPEIAALNAEIQAAKLDQSTAQGRYLPRVDAEYTNTFSLHAGGSTSSAGQKEQRLMMVLNWNLFNGKSDYYNQVERTARHKELQYRLDDQRRRVVQTLSANYATLTTTRERIASGYQELKSISTAAEAMSKRMLSGNQSLLDLLDVYDRFYQVRSRLVSLHILEMTTVAQLVRLTLGTPGSTSPIATEPSAPGNTKIAH